MFLFLFLFSFCGIDIFSNVLAVLGLAVLGRVMAGGAGVISTTRKILSNAKNKNGGIHP